MPGDGLTAKNPMHICKVSSGIDCTWRQRQNSILPWKAASHRHCGRYLLSVLKVVARIGAIVGFSRVPALLTQP
jgi:hypothetical protein